MSPPTLLFFQFCCIELNKPFFSLPNGTNIHWVAWGRNWGFILIPPAPPLSTPKEMVISMLVFPCPPEIHHYVTVLSLLYCHWSLPPLPRLTTTIISKPSSPLPHVAKHTLSPTFSHHGQRCLEEHWWDHVILPLKVLPWLAFPLRQLKCISLTWKTPYDPALTRSYSCSLTSHHIHQAPWKYRPSCNSFKAPGSLLHPGLHLGYSPCLILPLPFAPSNCFCIQPYRSISSFWKTVLVLPCFPCELS